MSDYIIIAVDAARARFFQLIPSPSPEYQGGPNLVEELSWTNPEQEMSGGEVFTTTRGRNRGVTRGTTHAYDDHRDDHYQEFQRRFAQRVALEGGRLAKGAGARFIVLAAEAQMLGHLRPELEDAIKKTAEIQEFPRDVTKLSPTQLHEHLAREGLLPKRQMPSRARRR